MARQRKRRSAKNASLDLFLGKTRGGGEKGSRETRGAPKEPGKPRPQPPPALAEKDARSKAPSPRVASSMNVESFIDTLLEQLFGGAKRSQRPRSSSMRGGIQGSPGGKGSPAPRDLRGTVEKTGSGGGRGVFAVDVKPPVGERPHEPAPRNDIVPRGRVLKELLARTADQLRRIECGQDGLCSDGRRISEVFVDEYGFRRQRGFVRTTRIPVFLDWVVEEAVVEKLLERAYVVKTNRGAMAIVPVDFLCELDKRYGVLLKNYDCEKYTVSPYTPGKKK